jgi:hypothetical protein
VAPANSDERRLPVNYFAWRSMTNYEAFHLGRMLADETLKGYISRRTGVYETYEAPRNAANCVLRGLAMLARCNRLDSTARHQADAR